MQVTTVLALATILWLTGCATATILKKDGKALTDATDKAVSASRTFHSALEKKRRHFLLEVVNSDRDSQLAWSAVLMPDTTKEYGFRMVNHVICDLVQGVFLKRDQDRQLVVLGKYKTFKSEEIS
jgi:hypothetical protein